MGISRHERESTRAVFSGVSVELNLSAFNISFNTPTSTSKTVEIAWRFAGERGMMMTVSNARGMGSQHPLFNATWISDFVEEDEYLWFGSVMKLRIYNVSMVASSRSYSRSMAALYLFDTVLSFGYITTPKRDELGVKVNMKIVGILDYCIKYILKQPLPPKPDCVDQYVLDTMYCFCQSKTDISLFPYGVDGSIPEFKELIYYKLSASAKPLNDRSNLCRSELFSLFPNLESMELRTRTEASSEEEYGVHFVSVMSMLEEAVIPPSFKAFQCVIKADGQSFKTFPVSSDAVPFRSSKWEVSWDGTTQSGSNRACISFKTRV